MSWKVLGIIAIAIWLSPIFIASWLNRPYPSKPLSLKLVTWKEIGRVEGCTDFDGDGNDELVVLDEQGQWWAVWWDERRCQRKKLPVPKNAFLSTTKHEGAVFGYKQGLQWHYCQVQFAKSKWQVKKVKEPIEDWLDAYGWQRREKNLIFAFADVDGDKRLDRIEWNIDKGELEVTVARQKKWKRKGKSKSLWAVLDLNSDGKAELVGVEYVGNDEVLTLDSPWRIVCWHFDLKERRWKSNTVQTTLVPEWWGVGEPWFPEISVVKWGKGCSLVGFAWQQRKTKIWLFIWQGDRWQVEPVGEVEGNAAPLFTGRDWLSVTELKPPWVHLTGRLSCGNWVTLMKVKKQRIVDSNFADLDGDGLKEFVWVFRFLGRLWVHVGKFVSGQWWLGKEKLPNKFVPYDLLGKNFRYRGINWALWQDENNRCVAVTVRREW
ncbi:MAG: hypothetical protein NZ805_14965 [Armatimonadetes bacterium]|nr:hypothetical protein [Armatimonadota bacterium]